MLADDIQFPFVCTTGALSNSNHYRASYGSEGVFSSLVVGHVTCGC